MASIKSAYKDILGWRKQFNSFFSFCDFISKEINDDIIKYYEDNQKKISELYHTQKKLTMTLTGFTHQNDAFLPDDYDIDDYFFDYSDYETFFFRNRKKNGVDIKVKRERIQSKMLDIHQEIYPSVKKL